jgi:predicted esterase
MKSANDLPVLILHSRQDQAISFDAGLKAKNTLKHYGYDVTFAEYEGGHVLTPVVLNRVVKWMHRK